jgi:hypothetical protein
MAFQLAKTVRGYDDILNNFWEVGDALPLVAVDFSLAAQLFALQF